MGRGLDGFFDPRKEEWYSLWRCAVLRDRGRRGLSPFSGGFSEGETPLPIPNRAVKPLSADGTWPARAWESRTPPVFSEVQRATPGWPALRFDAVCVVGVRASCQRRRDARLHYAVRRQRRARSALRSALRGERFRSVSAERCRRVRSPRRHNLPPGREQSPPAAMSGQHRTTGRSRRIEQGSCRRPPAPISGAGAHPGASRGLPPSQQSSHCVRSHEGRPRVRKPPKGSSRQAGWERSVLLLAR
jgi:hypothetical protein